MHAAIILNTHTDTHTFELVPGKDDAHVSWDGVKATAAHDVNPLLIRLAVVVQLHAL